MALGRPTKYKPEYCEQLLDHMERGFSYESFAGTIRVSKQTIYDWEKVNPDFLDAKSIAFELSRLFWEEQGIDGIFTEHQGRSLNNSAWIFNMKNRFNWTDKKEIKSEGTQEITLNYNLDSDGD